ncbi:Protein tyrosine kinase [Aspergillus sclerotialis]|uniref:Protein tyrosine kinase n=1 Tax=Aspergillus sclerotialis TaxID=2070753 RepID=A0A3A2Z1F3_9EURO|nr:Protein tyrosine kinase [Aspergillus sclerotialis]
MDGELFALGCLIYDIFTGERPYNEIDDSDVIERRYAAQIFPCLNCLRYQDIIFKCWTPNTQVRICFRTISIAASESVED